MLVLLVATQFAIPPLAERHVEKRLTAGGGSASVDLDAIPALRLLFTEGHSARVRARGIELPLVAPDRRLLAQLDGFDDVDVQVTDATAGPFRLSSVTLRRGAGEAAYRCTIRGDVTPRDLASFGAGQIGGGFGAFLGGLMGGVLPFGDEPVPIDIQAVLRSDDGRPRAVTVHGRVAGAPAGVLAEVLAQALAGRF